MLTFGVYLPAASYPDEARRLAFWNRLIERLQAQPGVASAAAITCAPLGCHWGNFFMVEGAPPRGKDDKNPVVLQRYATVDYFETMGIRLRDGRLFEPADLGPGEPRGAIVNEAFVREFLPGEAHPVGHRFRRASSARHPGSRFSASSAT